VTVLTALTHSDEKIRYVWDSEVLSAVGHGKLTSATLGNLQTSETSELEAIGLSIAVGHDPRSELVKGQVELDGEGYVVVQGRSTLTNLDGVFACGDLVDHTYRQAITAAGSGCSAALGRRTLPHRQRLMACLLRCDCAQQTFAVDGRNWVDPSFGSRRRVTGL